MTEVTPSPENTSFSDFFDYNCFTNTALTARGWDSRGADRPFSRPFLLFFVSYQKMICFQTIRKGLTMQTTVSSEKKYAPPKRSEKQIGNTTFIVNSFFREKSDESIAVKLERLMKADVQKEATT